MLFFPEGTRSKNKVMGGFKKGAFSVAVKAKAPVVPITLIGTGVRHHRVLHAVKAYATFVACSRRRARACAVEPRARPAQTHAF